MLEVEARFVEAEKTDGEKYRIPYWEVQSDQTGPCVLMTAAMHGNEVQGAEVLRRFLPLVEEGLVRGSCLMVPFANPLAVRGHQPHIDFELSRYPGYDKRDNLNCTWPGDANGNNAERLSNALSRALEGRATHLIDLHCWNLFWATSVLAREGHDMAERLANVTALRFGKRTGWYPERDERPVLPCTLSAYLNDTDRAAICIEFAGQYGVWHREVDRGVRALANCLRILEMLPGELEGQDEGPVWMNDAEESKALAPCSGLFVRAAWHTSDWVDEGASLGHILSDADLSCVEVKAEASGYLYQYGCAHENTSEHSMMWTHPHVKEGEAVAIVIVP